MKGADLTTTAVQAVVGVVDGDLHVPEVPDVSVESGPELKCRRTCTCKRACSLRRLVGYDFQGLASSSVLLSSGSYHIEDGRSQLTFITHAKRLLSIFQENQKTENCP